MLPKVMYNIFFSSFIVLKVIKYNFIFCLNIVIHCYLLIILNINKTTDFFTKMYFK